MSKSLYFSVLLFCVPFLHAVWFKGTSSRDINFESHIAEVFYTEPGVVAWWKIVEGKNDRDYFIFSPDQIKATDNKIPIPVKKEYFKYIEQAIFETDRVQKSIDTFCEDLSDTDKADKGSFEKCKENVAREKVYFLTVLNALQNSSLPGITEQDFLRIFLFLKKSKGQFCCNPPRYSIMMTKIKSLDFLPGNPKYEAFEDCDWTEARCIISCHQDFRSWIARNWISCNPTHPDGAVLPWYHPRYISEWQYQGGSGKYGPYFQERLSWGEKDRCTKEKDYMGELIDIYKIDEDPRTYGLKEKKDKIMALCKRPDIDYSVPLKQLVHNNDYADLL